MKKLFYLFFCAIAATIIWTNKEVVQKTTDDLLFYSPCKAPKTYTISSVDTAFGKSEQEILELTIKAAEIWNDAYRSDLLVYNPHGQIKIELIFDERQSTLIEINKMDSLLIEEQPELEDNLEKYKKQSLELERAFNDLNSKIIYWNSKGGAPEKEYKEILKQQEELKARLNQLNIEAKAIDNKATEFNKKVEILDKNVATFNEILDKKPEGGIFITGINKIEIYTFNSEDEFIHLMAHELGHALGLGHTDSLDSLMYPVSGSSTKLSNDDLILLREYCQDRNIFREIYNRITAPKSLPYIH